MESEIFQKLDELKAMDPQNPEFKQWLKNSNLWGWLYSQFKVQGQAISKPAVVDLLAGNIREDVPLSCYGFVQGFKDMHKDMQSDIAMNTSPNPKQFRRWTQMLCPEAEQRKTNPVVFEYGLIPCHFNSIDSELDAAFKKYNTSKLSDITAACVLFLDIIRIYPFDDETVDMAMSALLYCLEGMGIPLPELSVGEDEFGRLISAYMDHGDHLPFTDMLQRCIYNRIDAVLMLAKQAREQEGE